MRGKEIHKELSLLRWVVCKGDTLGNVALKTFDSSLEECLLAVINTAEDVDCFLGTSRLGTTLVATSSLLDGSTTWDTIKINKRWLDKTFLAIESSDHLLGESVHGYLQTT
jgi:hypothetical protein